MSFFSYQPSQGLSAFRTKPLQRTGAQDQDFIDPTLAPSEGIDDLSAGDSTMDPRNIGKTDSGGFFSTSTGTQFGVSDQLRGLLDEQAQNPQAAAAAAQGPSGADSGTGTQAVKNLVSGAQMAQKLAKATEGPESSLFGKEKQSTESVDLNAPETDWTSPAAVGSYLQNNPQSKLSLYAREFNQTPEDVSKMVGQGGAPFDLGVNTKLDSSFLDSYNPTTGARAGGFGDMNTEGFTGTPRASLGGGVSALQGALSIAAGASKGEMGSILGGSAQLASGLANIFPDQVAAIGEVLKASLAEAGMGGLLESGGEALSGLGIEAIGDLSPYIAAAKGLFDIAMIASNDNMSDGDKAIEATKAATKVVAAIAAPYTFGASLAVTQIWDMVDNLRRGMPIGESMVRAADPTAIIDMEGGGIANRLYAPSKDWQTFIPRLMQGQSTQGEAFDMIQKAMPYVRTKEELGKLINAAEGWVSSATGIARTDLGDPYQLNTIPGVGPKTHGQKTTPIDWRNSTVTTQDIIDRYLDVLPGERLPADATPEMLNLSGADANRLWNQFRGKDPTVGSPTHMRDYVNSDPITIIGESGGYSYQIPGPSDVGYWDIYSEPGKTTPWYGAQGKLRTGWDPNTGAQTWYNPEEGFANIPTFEEQFQPSSSWYQFMTGIDPAQLAEQQTNLAGQQQPQGLSQFNPENQQPVDDRGIPDDGKPGHPYELDQNGKPVHPEVWGIPGIRVH